MDYKKRQEYQENFSFLIQDVLKEVKEIRETITTDVNNTLSSAITAFADQIRQELSELKLDKFDKQTFTANLLKWGEFGWTLLDFANFELYCDEAPDNCKKADEKALIYCLDENIDKVISCIKDNILAKADFDDAIFCYRNMRWKPCAMVLFGIIESMFIRVQPKSGDSNKRRKIGTKAFDLVENKIVEINGFSPRFLTLGHHLTTLKALSVIYKNGDDFSNENPDVVNRQFINHGMSKRVVTKIDCIKLLMALDGVIKIFDTYGLTYQS